MRKEETGRISRRLFLQLASGTTMGLAYRIFFPAIFKEATPPLGLGNILLEDQSERLDIKWRNEQSIVKVQEAFLVMWARKRNTTPEEIRNQLSRGQRIIEPVIYPKLEASGLTTIIEDSVDLSNRAKVVLWDEPDGYGCCSAQRLRFLVENESLTFYIYRSSEAKSSFAAVSGIAEALVMIWNNGKSVVRDPLEIFPEFNDLLVAPDGQGWFAPEIETIWH